MTDLHCGHCLRARGPHCRASHQPAPGCHERHQLRHSAGRPRPRRRHRTTYVAPVPDNYCAVRYVGEPVLGLFFWGRASRKTASGLLRLRRSKRSRNMRAKSSAIPSLQVAAIVLQRKAASLTEVTGFSSNLDGFSPICGTFTRHARQIFSTEKAIIFVL